MNLNPLATAALLLSTMLQISQVVAQQFKIEK